MKQLLRAEEALLAAHGAALKRTRASMPEEERMLEAAPDGDMEGYARQLRALLQQKREGLEALEATLAEYEQQCRREDEARRNVKGVHQPWD